MRAVAAFALAGFFIGGSAEAQTPGGPPTSDWSFSAAAYTYIVPEAANYVQPAVTADRSGLHLEARFNYEDRDTGSAWIGYNIGAGESVVLDITPMVGIVLGNTTGIAPGYRLSLGWRALELYSETEYVFDADDSADSFLYTWSELAVAPADWCRFGLVVQRTKVYDTEFDIQRGFLAGLSFNTVDVGVYFFNPDASRPTVVLSVGVGF